LNSQYESAFRLRSLNGGSWPIVLKKSKYLRSQVSAEIDSFQKCSPNVVREVVRISLPRSKAFLTTLCMANSWHRRVGNCPREQDWLSVGIQRITSISPGTGRSGHDFGVISQESIGHSCSMVMDLRGKGVYAFYKPDA